MALPRPTPSRVARARRRLRRQAVVGELPFRVRLDYVIDKAVFTEQRPFASLAAAYGWTLAQLALIGGQDGADHVEFALRTARLTPITTAGGAVSHVTEEVTAWLAEASEPGSQPFVLVLDEVVTLLGRHRRPQRSDATFFGGDVRANFGTRVNRRGPQTPPQSGETKP